MATGTNPFDARPKVRGRIECYLILPQDIPNNRSLIGIQLIAEETQQQPTWSLPNTKPFYYYLNGVLKASGTWAYDFRPSGLQSYVLVNTSVWMIHNPDGTLTISATARIDGNAVPTDLLGTSYPSTTLVLPRIPRGPKVKRVGQYKNTIVYIKVGGIYKQVVQYIKIAGIYRAAGG